MPRRKRGSDDPALKPVPVEVLDQFVDDGLLTAEDIEAAMRRFKKALIERALGAELTHHLGYPAGAGKPEEGANKRNGSTPKSVLTEDGPVAIEVPRDRDGSFEPVLIPKHERRFTGFDDKVLALYARGLSVREIQKFLAEMYAVEVSPDLISSVTDAVVSEVTAWQARPLEPMYPVVFFDALRVKIRDEGVVRSKAIYLAQSLHGLTDPWVPRHPHCRDRWPQRHERGAQRRVSADHAANLHRPPDSPQPGLRQLARSESAGDGPEARVHRRQRGGGRGRPR
jgi:hypothetical protein